MNPPMEWKVGTTLTGPLPMSFGAVMDLESSYQNEKLKLDPIRSKIKVHATLPGHLPEEALRTFRKLIEEGQEDGFIPKDHELGRITIEAVSL